MPGINRTGISQERIEELREDFASVDSDEDGCIDFGEFANLMDNLSAGVSSADLRIGVGEIDSDRDGRISLAEFVAWRLPG